MVGLTEMVVGSHLAEEVVGVVIEEMIGFLAGQTVPEVAATNGEKPIA